MEEHVVQILNIEKVTHDVKRYTIQKPEGYRFIPGQATEVAINLPDYINERRPFTFTSLNEWENLEFTIKSYRDHEGVTKKLDTLLPGNELLLHDVWGTIHYEEPGTFIAGGAGVTPFIAILRSLYSQNKIEGNRLIFANKTREDIILENEFRTMKGLKFINILSQETAEGYTHGFINEQFLKEHSGESKYYYLCGPPPMIDSVEAQLKNIHGGQINLVKEEI